MEDVEKREFINRLVVELQGYFTDRPRKLSYWWLAVEEHAAHQYHVERLKEQRAIQG